jgi:hypothetical protein
MATGVEALRAALGAADGGAELAGDCSVDAASSPAVNHDLLGP